jgi:SNF2 family DNA or RNA helicase
VTFRASSSRPGPFCLHCRVRHIDLGLGVVDTMTPNAMLIRFDSGATAQFNPKSAPLARAFWREGEAVLVRGEEVLGLVVHRARDEAGLVHYGVRCTDSGRVLNVQETRLSEVPPVEDPAELLAQGKFDDPKLFYYRTVGQYLAAARQQFGANRIAARIVPRPHQVFVAQRVLEAPRPRFLLADEVGLGKTIEAGLIVQELRARGALERVLIVVPPTLTVQWLYELRQKFNERFKLYDSAVVRREREAHPGENVWELGRNIICSQRYLATNAEARREILEVPWDMVIFDEAHHIRRRLDSGDRWSTTELYRFASRLSQRTRGLLLLTATPMQLHPSELFSLVELLDPALFVNYAAFEEQRERNAQLNALLNRLAEADTLQPFALDALIEALLPFVGTDNPDLAEIGRSELARDRVIERLLPRHLLSEVLIRNRKRLVGGFKRRLPQVIQVTLTEEEQRLHEAAIAHVRAVYAQVEESRRIFAGFMLSAYQKRLASSPQAFRRTLENRLAKLAARETRVIRTDTDSLQEVDLDLVLRQYGDAALVADGLAVETEIAGLRALLDQANEITVDTKFAALEATILHLCEENPDEQVLIFTQFTDTLHYLDELLSERWTVATFHGQLPPREKDRAIGAFTRGEAQILISTEAGGEGRNLQFCATLVNYDLPWNPMKVEQRIGRLDRIGQERDVRIINFSLQGTVEERVLEVLSRRINAFEETIGGLDPILGQMELDVQRLMLESQPEQFNARLGAYADHLEAEVMRARAADEALRDLIVDRRSFDSRSRTLFEDSEQERLSRHANKLSKSLLKYLGAEIRPLADDTYRIRLGREMRVELPGLVRETYQVTFNYRQAVEETLIEYGSFGHPLFDALLSHVTSDAFQGGLTAQRTVMSEQHAGFVGLQFNFLAKLGSIPRMVVVVIGLDGRERTDLRELLLDSFDWRNEQHALSNEAVVDWSDLVQKLYGRAEDLLEHELREDAERTSSRAQERHDIERRKLEHFFSYRETEGERKLAHDEAVFNRLSDSDRDEDHRVVPLWQRTVINDKTYLRNLAVEREQQYRELDKRLELGYSYELLNAACVTIVPPSAAITSEDLATRDTEAAK